MCPRSWAAATPVKYKRDIQQLTYVLALVKNSENNGTEEISLDPPPLVTWDGLLNCLFCALPSIVVWRLIHVIHKNDDIGLGNKISQIA